MGAAKPTSLLLAALAAALAVGCSGDAEDRAGARGDAPFGRLDDSDASADAALPPPLAIPDDAPRVLVLSDSYGAALHLAEHQAFPAVLQRRLAEEGLPFHLVNASESGRTTAGGAGALDWTLRGEPDLVVIALGGNDGLRGIPIEEVERNLRRMIERSRAAGARVLLLGVRIPPSYGDYALAFDALYPRLAEDYGVDFLPFYMEGVADVDAMKLADGLHPTPEGHEKLADTVEPALRAALRALDG